MWNIFSSGSSPKPASLPEGVERVNDALYQLYSPPRGEIEVDIIFFHGLQIGNDYTDAYWKTWSSDGTTIWPQTLLGVELPQARILSVSFDSCVRKSAKGGRGDFYTIGENLVQDIILHEEANVGRDQRPVILVGHSLGGLVIKEFIVMAQRQRNDLDSETDKEKIAIFDKFLANFSGVFYYATPHKGTTLADVAAKAPGNSEVLLLLKTLSKETARLNEDFRKWRAKHMVPAFTLAEQFPTKLWHRVNFTIVEEGSARDDTDGLYSVPADHIRICKPENVKTSSFQKLYDFIKGSTSKRIQTLTEKRKLVDENLV